METYFTPAPHCLNEKEAVLSAFRRGGFEPVASDRNGLWIIRFAGAQTFIQFQEKDNRLVFATVDMPMLNEDISFKVGEILESIGWVADNDNIG